MANYIPPKQGKLSQLFDVFALLAMRSESARLRPSTWNSLRLTVKPAPVAASMASLSIGNWAFCCWVWVSQRKSAASTGCARQARVAATGLPPEKWPSLK